MSYDKRTSLLFHKIDTLTLQTRVTDIVCGILFLLGVVGNILGLFIFLLSRRTWRISSVYACLATCSSIINLLCVIRYTSILHSTSRQILQQLVDQTWWACKFYEVSSSFRIISSWITLFWMFERLMCVSTKLRRFFNRWNSFQFKFFTPLIIVIVILSCVIGPLVYLYQPTIISNNDTMNSTINIIYCGIHPNISIKWQKYFYEVHFGMNYFTIRCLFSELIPTGMIILFNSYIIYHLIHTKRRLYQTSGGHQLRKEQSRTASSMNIVLIFHSSLFLISLLSHIVGHLTILETHETWWILLAVLINCSINFYVYCLSGKAFRNEICRFFERFKIRLFHRRAIHQHRRQRSSQNQRLLHQMIPIQDRIRSRFNP